MQPLYHVCILSFIASFYICCMLCFLFYECHAAMLEVYLLWTNSESNGTICKFQCRGYSQTVNFDWCIFPHATVCKHTQVYDVILVQHSVPPTWWRQQCRQNDVTVTPCIRSMHHWAALMMRRYARGFDPSGTTNGRSRYDRTSLLMLCVGFVSVGDCSHALTRHATETESTGPTEGLSSWLIATRHRN